MSAHPINLHSITSLDTYEVNSIGDGSCLLHAILNAFQYNYITRSSNGKPIDVMRFVRKLRTQLSQKLSQEYKEGVSYYNYISRGSLIDLSKTYPEYSLEGLKMHLDSSNPLGLEVIEFLSLIIDYDIYLIDKNKGDVYITGDEELFQTGRSGIVIVYEQFGNNGHYTTCMVRDQNNRYWSVFPNQDPFLIDIRDRMKKLKPLEFRQ